MTEEFVYPGIWFLPGKPNRQVGGTLRFTPNGGAELDVISNVGDDFVHMWGVSALALDVILGISPDAGAITLVNCQRRRSRHRTVSDQTSALHYIATFSFRVAKVRCTPLSRA